MDQKIRNYVSESLSQVAVEAGLGEATITPLKTPFSPDTVINIGITGEWHGFFFLQARNNDLLALMEKMMLNLGYQADRDDRAVFAEAFQELANQTSGRLIMLMADEGINGNITPPSVLQGTNLSLELSDFTVTTNLLFSFKEGDLAVLVGLKK